MAACVLDRKRGRKRRRPDADGSLLHTQYSDSYVWSSAYYGCARSGLSIVGHRRPASILAPLTLRPPHLFPPLVQIYSHTPIIPDYPVTCTQQAKDYDSCPDDPQVASWGSLGCFTGYSPSGPRISSTTTDLATCAATCFEYSQSHPRRALSAALARYTRADVALPVSTAFMSYDAGACGCVGPPICARYHPMLIERPLRSTRRLGAGSLPSTAAHNTARCPRSPARP